MSIRNILGVCVLAVLATMEWGCSGDDAVDFSGNVKPTLNVTGNYEVIRTPRADLKNITLTQTNNRVQAIDNTGVVYTGTTPGDLVNITLNEAIGSQTIVTSVSLQGRDAAGNTRTLVLTSITFAVTDPFSTPTTTTDLASAIKIRGLAGTYTDSTGVSGAIELQSNALQP